MTQERDYTVALEDGREVIVRVAQLPIDERQGEQFRLVTVSDTAKDPIDLTEDERSEAADAAFVHAQQDDWDEEDDELEIEEEDEDEEDEELDESVPEAESSQTP